MRLTEEMLIRVERQHEKIGQLLLRYTSLTEEQLAEALEDARRIKSSNW